MTRKLILFATIALLLGYDLASAKVDLVILPKRDTVQLTIYNSADLTLVRERRALTLKSGLNSLQFSWANTLIDPTSLDMLPSMHADQIDILDLTFPPRVRNLGLWHVKSRISGKVPVEINYLTSGLSWRAFYMGTLSTDEKVMRLQGYVRVTNNSGEDYENAQVRMIVGKIHLIDRIVDLGRRQYPYDRPGPAAAMPKGRIAAAEEETAEVKRAYVQAEKVALARPKEIKKEGLSEYFLYTIEGTETIPHGWSKRLPSFAVDEVPVVNLYKYEEERYGNQVVRFLSFKNDTEHNLGDTPIPGGTLKVYRTLDESAHLSYEGQSSFKYIPVNEDVELSLGPVANVILKPTLMDFKTDRYLFHDNGNISGWDEIRTFEVEVKNTRDIPIKVEVTRNFGTSSWDLTKSGDFGTFKKVDLDTVKFTLMLNGHEIKRFTYILTTHHGQRAD
ncbi:MAG TPA: DUF4139 domain-containing protein [Desulfatiglandales bacterium]|nr:DUF4139 domain-containing protein [Desulfatiglandales bacterium]